MDILDRAAAMGHASDTRTPDWRQVFTDLDTPHQGHALASAIINAFEGAYDAAHR